MKDILLSICIPTYNRGDYLIAAINSVVEQISTDLASKIQIVISDNASTDNSEELVKEYITNHKNYLIVFFRNDTNLGADMNYLKAVEHADGVFCWFLGSDDMIAPNSLAKILGLIKSNDTIYLFNRIDCTKNDMRPIKDTYFFNSSFKDYVFKLNSIENYNFYFSNCCSLGGVFSYISSIVFKRSEWNRITDYQDYIGTAYVHSYILLKALLTNKDSSIRCINEGIVFNRTGNDSFYNGLYNRMMLDFNGYLKLSTLFENEMLRYNFLSILRREHPVVNFKAILFEKKCNYDHLMETMKECSYSEKDIEYYNFIRKNRFLFIPAWFVGKVISKLFRH